MKQLYLVLMSVHGLIRGRDLELGRDADTGGQTLYVLELAQALSERPEVARVDLMTRRVVDPDVSDDYAQPIERVSDQFNIVRIDAGPEEYLPKEQLWDHLDAFVDNAFSHLKQQSFYPHLIHSHYADAGYVGAHLSSQLGVPLIHTGHSLGRVKRARLLASGLSAPQIEETYNMSRRIEAEEMTLAVAERVITSTRQEIEEQYALYDYYQPNQMRVLPPGTNLEDFHPVRSGDPIDTELRTYLTRSLVAPERPMILALSRPDRRKNIVSLVEAYGQSEWLQAHANLVIIAGNRDDLEEMDDATEQVFTELFLSMDRYDLYGKVALPKHHQRDQVPEIYRIAAASNGVFVNPALTEPFGLTLIEAAASGLPLVATEDGGPRDILDNCHNGYLINPLAPETIARAIEKLLKDPALYADKVSHGLAGVTEHYSWQAHAESYMQLIEPLVKNNQRLERPPIARRQGLYHERAFVTSLDQNLVGDREAIKTLMQRLKTHRQSTLYVVATSRRYDSALQLMKTYGMSEPDVLISSGGTDIRYAPNLTRDQAWLAHIDYQWTPHRVRAVMQELPGLVRQPRLEQSHFKLSYYVDLSKISLDQIKKALYEAEQSVHVQLSFDHYIDILPIRASKGLALRYVMDRWQVPLAKTFVAGGAGADEDMMRGNPLAAVVANRHHEELSNLAEIDRIYYAESAFEQGILEALDYYDFFCKCVDPREVKTREDKA
mgnify:CR=1 FL=1